MVLLVINIDYLNLNVAIHEGRIGYLLEGGFSFFRSIILDKVIQAVGIRDNVDKTHITDIIYAAEYSKRTKAKQNADQ
jgi:hypothetical protein